MRDQQDSTILVRTWLLGEFMVERRRADETWETIDKKAWGSNGYARRVMKRLLHYPRRRALRGTIVEDLWPDAEMMTAEDTLNRATYQLRKVLTVEGQETLLKTFGTHLTSGYELTGQSLLWTDVDACDALMHKAERIGRTTSAALPLLEKAIEYFERGSCLEGEGGQWCHAVRTHVEQAMKRCQIWLAEAYEAQGMQWHAQTQLRALLNANPLDEDVLCRLMGMLHRHGMTQDALRVYEETQKCFREEYQFSLSDTTQKLAERMKRALPSIDGYLNPIETKLAPSHGQRLQPSLPSTTQDIIKGANEQEGQDMDKLRRHILQRTLQATSTTVFVPVYDRLYPDALDRFLRALKKPSGIDTTTLNYLNQRTLHYWSDRSCRTIAPHALLHYVVEHSQRLTQFLESSLQPTVRRDIYSISSRTALLIGALLFDMGEYEQARNVFTSALQAAQEANDATLQALCWGWISFTWTYSKNALAALVCVQEGRRFAEKSSDHRAQAWLAAIEAEIQAHLRQSDACLKALDDSEKIKDVKPPFEDYHLTEFDHSRLAGYKGACFRKLYHPEKAQTYIYLENAQQALKESLATRQRPGSTHLLDLAWTYVMQEEIEEACKYAMQAVPIMQQTKSQTEVLRLADLRLVLEPWKDTRYVKSLDEHVIHLHM
jgi:DNA-binding SARP family transcriptional activator